MVGQRIPSSVGARVLSAVILTGTLSVLDSTLVVPLLTTIGDDLGGGSEVSWLVAGYLLTSTVTIPVWGRILDLRGERQVMWTSLIIFLVGTVAAVTAPSIEALIVARLIQGVGAGGIVPVGQAILASRCTSEERARLQVYYNVAYGAAAGLGPLIGGAIVNVSWRWAFALIIPIIFLAGALLIGQLHDKTPEVETRRFDVVGSVLMTFALTLLLLGIERGWLASTLVGAVLLGVFIAHALRRRHGLVPSSLLTSRVILATVGVAFIIGLLQFALLTYLPLLSQRVAPDLNSGLVVMPLTILWMTLGAVTGTLALRVGTRPLALIGVVLGVASAVVLVLSTAYPALLLASVLVGTAAGLVLIPLLLLGQHAAARDDVGASTSFMVLTRNFGGAIGAAGMAVLLADLGVTMAFTVLAVVVAAAIVPALLLPSPRAEHAILARRDGVVGGGTHHV